MSKNIFFANLGDFLTNLAQKGLSVRPLRPPPFGSAPENYSLDYSFNLMIYCTVITVVLEFVISVIFYLIMTSWHILSLQSVMQCHVSRPTDMTCMTDTDYNLV